MSTSTYPTAYRCGTCGTDQQYKRDSNGRLFGPHDCSEKYVRAEFTMICTTCVKATRAILDVNGNQYPPWHKPESDGKWCSNSPSEEGTYPLKIKNAQGSLSQGSRSGSRPSADPRPPTPRGRQGSASSASNLRPGSQIAAQSPSPGPATPGTRGKSASRESPGAQYPQSSGQQANIGGSRSQAGQPRTKWTKFCTKSGSERFVYEDSPPWLEAGQWTTYKPSGNYPHIWERAWEGADGKQHKAYACGIVNCRHPLKMYGSRYKSTGSDNEPSGRPGSSQSALARMKAHVVKRHKSMPIPADAELEHYKGFARYSGCPPSAPKDELTKKIQGSGHGVKDRPFIWEQTIIKDGEEVAHYLCRWVGCDKISIQEDSRRSGALNLMKHHLVGSHYPNLRRLQGSSLPYSE